MSLPAHAVAAFVLAGSFGSAFLANEWSHGELSEATGLGHHHMLDYGGIHCSGHNGSAPPDHEPTHAPHTGAAAHDADASPHGLCGRPDAAPHDVSNATGPRSRS